MKRYASLLVILAGACWGSIGVFVRALNHYGIETMEIVEARAIIALVFIGVGILVYDKKLFKVQWKHLWCFAGTGIIGIIFFNLCYFMTIKVTSLSVAAVLLYTAPIFVMILSAPLFKEKITSIKLLSLLMAFVGCMMVSGIFDGGAVLNTKGLIIGICSGIGYALYTIFTRYALNYGYHPLTVQFYTFVFGTVGGAFLTDFKQMGETISIHSPRILLVLFAIGFIATAVPNVVYTMGMKYIENGKTSIMASMEPVMAIAFGIFVFHEIPSFVATIGICLTLGGIILVNYQRKPS
ncbi:DME family drug/metabolite transporter [Clostridiales Family XIII bacterium PM5-7]